MTAIHLVDENGIPYGVAPVDNKPLVIANLADTEGMEATHQGEKILKQGTKYILRITSGTADNLTNVQIDWYEHINKTA